MKYQVLRNCFTQECVYYKKGAVVELPVAMFKDKKNFRLMGEPESVPEPEPTPEPEPEPRPEVEPEPSPEAPEPITKPENELVCSVCGKECKSAFGLKSHVRIHK